MRKAHQIRPKIQVIVFLLTCDTRVLVYTRFWAATNIDEKREQKNRREKEEKESSHQQLSFFSVAAQKSINPQRLNRWIVSILDSSFTASGPTFCTVEFVSSGLELDL